ncbi:hypothetical protein A0J61_08613 [Choanephora cucurbitarum]|uniref:Uncharacterized protein n=1 Tax=Choanephora cucurbitarum TaxID=101091 RepID=A0A1C7N2G0_9FUNG|nr:hypothetical protein A0J61_08613 [Choanephora cucurbitarum]
MSQHQRGDNCMQLHGNTILIHPTPATDIIQPTSTLCFSYRRPKHSFVWCFRPLGSTQIWRVFGKQNQQVLMKHHHQLTQCLDSEDVCKVQEKSVLGSSRMIHVMLREGVAFVLDPEWPEPMTFEITCLPKLTFWQRLKNEWLHRRNMV